MARWHESARGCPTPQASQPAGAAVTGQAAWFSSSCRSKDKPAEQLLSIGIITECFPFVEPLVKAGTQLISVQRSPPPPAETPFSGVPRLRSAPAGVGGARHGHKRQRCPT
ncbi:unnamed protein product [Lampetra fluviatilis]